MGTALARVLETRLGKKIQEPVFTWLATVCIDLKFCFRNLSPELSGI
jgi:hypothetical protein